MIFGEHRGKQVEIQYDSAIAKTLQARADRVAEKAEAKNNSRMAARFRAEAEAWSAVIEHPERLSLMTEFADLRKQYLNHVLYSEDGFQAMFTKGDSTMTKEQIEATIEAALTDEDIAAWHEGELTAHAEELVERFGTFQVWGDRQGGMHEPLRVVLEA
jgi:hypothetical protein